MERKTRIMGLDSEPAVEQEFLELERDYEVLWARKLDSDWAVSLEKASPEAPYGTAPYRARAMDKNVRNGYHDPIKGLNSYNREKETRPEAEKSARTLLQRLSNK